MEEMVADLILPRPISSGDSSYCHFRSSFSEIEGTSPESGGLYSDEPEEVIEPEFPVSVLPNARKIATANPIADTA